MLPPDELPDPTRDLNQIKMAEWLDQVIPQQERTGNIYHYTNAQGLLGILHSGSLWATHSLGLNDVSEVRYAQQLVLEVIDSISQGAAQASRDFLSHVKGLMKAADLLAAPYLVCFSDRDNLLSQWREYGAQGDGFAIGFDKQILAPVFGDSAVLLKVVYDRNLQTEIVRSTTTRFCAVLARQVARNLGHAETVYTKVPGRLCSRLTLQLVALKHPGFEEEHEWRIVHFHRFGEDRPPPKYRAGRFGIVPYKDLTTVSGPKLPIKTITQGPTADRVLAKHAVEMLLRDSGYLDVKIEASDIPLR